MGISSVGSSTNSLSSVAERNNELFGKIDGNQDGKISESEFSAFDELMKAQGMDGSPPPPPESDSTGQAGAPPGPPPDAATTFANADTNADGSLSIDELSSMLAEHDTRGAMASQSSTTTTTGETTTTSTTTTDDATSSSVSDLFSSLDANGDGSLDLDELTALFKPPTASNGADGTSTNNLGQLETLLAQLSSSSTA